MKDERYLYLFRNIETVEILLCLKVYKAETFEKRLHFRYKDDRFSMKTRRRNWFKRLWIKLGIVQEIKIGITCCPNLRINQIAENKRKDGHTEWFELNPLQVWILSQWVKWYAFRYKVRRLFIKKASTK